MGAAETDDFDRWLTEWAVHNPDTRDQVLSVMDAARSMGGKITEADAIEIADRADEVPYLPRADTLAKSLGVTYAQRQELRLTTIGSTDVKKRARRVLRKRKDRLYQERKRRERGARPQSESLSATQPWRDLEMSRATWYRRNKERNETNETTSSALIFLILKDGPVSPERGAGTSERGSAPKEARGLTSSQTATTMAADIHGSLPLELRLLALGLPMPQNFARAA